MEDYDVSTIGLVTIQDGYGTVFNTACTASTTRFTCLTRDGDHIHPNPQNLHKEVVEAYHGNTGSTFTWMDGGTATRRTDGVVGGVNNFPNHLINPYDYDEAICDKAMAKIYDAVRGNSNFAADLAESPETIRMLRQTLSLKKFIANFLKKEVRSFRRRGRAKRQNGSGLAKTRKTDQKLLDWLTSRWLEYRYGWKPLVGSIYDCLDNLGQKINTGTVTINRRASERLVKQQTTGEGTINSPSTVVITETSVRCEISVQLGLPDGKRLSDWTSLNPVAIAWELVPFSFVADWVFTVGQQLDAWENWFLFNQDFFSGYMTIGHKTTTTRNASAFEARTEPLQRWSDKNRTIVDGQTLTSWLNLSQTRLTTDKRRMILAGLPTPGRPRVKLRLGAERQLDAAALIHQLVGKRLR